MIYLEQGQKLVDRPELVVYEATGERADTDMVICAKAETPSEPFCWLEAQYIAYGGVVYKISDNAELEAEILKTDPDSTINDVVANPVDAAVEPVNPLDQVVQNVDPAHELDTSKLDQTQPVSSGTPASATETQPTTTSTSTSATASTTTSVIEIENTNATSTQTSTSTEPVVVPEPTPTPAPVEQAATTTDPIVTTRRRTKKNIS